MGQTLSDQLLNPLQLCTSSGPDLTPGQGEVWLVALINGGPRSEFLEALSIPFWARLNVVDNPWETSDAALCVEWRKLTVGKLVN